MADDFTDDLRVHVDAKDGSAEVAVAGELDVATAPALQGALASLLGEGTREVRLDLAGLTFMGSTGVNLLVGVAKKLEEAGGKLRVTAVTPPVRRVFEVSGVGERLGLEG